MNQTAVLIVEDEVMIALETSEVVKELGCLVTGIVSTGEDAVAHTRTHKTDIILMDIHLAGQIDGIEAAATIRAEANIPVIFLTAHSDSDFLDKAKKVLPCGYLVKPVQERDLRISIEMALHAATIESQRKKAEDALIQSQKQYSDLVESANAIIIKWDSKGRLTFINKFAQEFFGYDKTEVIGKELFGILIPATDRSGMNLKTMLDNILTAPETYIVNENENVKKDGSRVWISWSNKAIKDEDGNLLEVLSMGHDVSRQKRIQEKLSNRTSMLQVVLDSIQESALLLDPKGDILFANKTVAKRVNRPLNQITSTNIDQHLPKELAEARMKAVREVIKDGEPITYKEVRESMHFENFVYPVTNAEGSVLGASILSVDITDRVNSELNLKKLWLALEQSPISIIITNHQGLIEHTNPGFSASTGYSNDEVLGKYPWILKSDQVETSAYLKIWALLKSGHSWQGELSICKKNGKHSWEQVSISPVVNTSGEIVHYIAVMEDITKKKELEHLREDIQGIMRHDLRTPLTAIIGYPPLLLNSELTDRQKEQVNSIAQSGNRMLQIIDSYLNISKIEAGTFEPSPQILDLNEIIEDVLRDLTSLKSVKALEPVVLIDDTPIENSEKISIYGEAALCYSMLENLIKNAMEASPPEKEILIEVHTGPENTEISISNLGTVPEAIRERFFEKYVSCGKTEGTGFGTYSARLIVENQGGTISMKTSEATGTKVTITLPVQ